MIEGSNIRKMKLSRRLYRATKLRNWDLFDGDGVFIGTFALTRRMLRARFPEAIIHRSDVLLPA